MKTIGYCAFEGCTKLACIIIGSGVTEIHDAFQKCPLRDVYCLAEEGPSSTVFPYKYNITLHVFASYIDNYKSIDYWRSFKEIVAIEDGEIPSFEQCAKPSIYYSNGKLSFKSDTEDVRFVSEIKDSDIGKYNASEVDLAVTYTISVYATKDGYTKSDVATATLCGLMLTQKKRVLLMTKTLS